MSLRPLANRFTRGGLVPPEFLVSPPPETITPEVEAVIKYVPPLSPVEQRERDCIAVMSYQIPKLLEDLQAESKAQILGFSFSARRFGDFLMLELERKANQHKEFGTKFATCINLGKISSIRLIAGHDIKQKTKTFSISNNTQLKLKDTASIIEHFAGMPPVRVPKWRPFIKTTEIILSYESEVFMRQYQRDHRFATESFCVDDVPHPSEDDKIEFIGNETYLVPHGLGETVLFQVMEAIEKGWEKPVLPSLTP